MKTLKPRGIIVFRADEIGPILNQVKRQTIRPKLGGVIREGSTYEAKTDKKSQTCFATIKIERVVIKRMKSLTESDIKADGYLSLDLLKERWMSTYGRWNPERFVRVISFRVVHDSCAPE